jgi:hydrogenase expression/formation protein HypC
MAEVSVGGVLYRASLQLLDDVRTGDYVLLHTGFAIEKLNPEEAAASLEVFREFIAFNRELDKESTPTDHPDS